MTRLFLPSLLVATLLACGPKPRPIPDGGEDAGEDAGVDAGRPRGDDPANGWSTAVELAADAGLTTRLGVSVASAPDQHLQPLIAGVLDDPNGDGTRIDTRVFFTRWNGVDRAFEATKAVETVGEVDLTPPHRQVSIARDPATGRLGIAYVKGADTIRFAWSDDEGANFSLQTVSANTTSATVSNPQLALKANVLHLAYVQGDALLYRKRTGVGAFTDETAPLPGGAALVVPGPVSLALDDGGNPGVAYFVAGAAPFATLAFWRPGTAAATVVADSAAVDVLTQAERRPSVTLTFAGALPRVAYHLRNLPPLATADDTTELWYAAATDAAGSAWATPVPIPRNGDATRFNSTRWFQAVVAETSGKATVAAYFGANGIVGAQCGGPKLARSDTGTSFLTCAPVNTPFNFAGEYLSLWSHKPGKLTLVFHSDSRSNPAAKPGVVLWREP